MIKYESVTHYELKFEEGKPLPLYYLYTLLGQEYEVFRNEPHLLTDRGEDADYVLDTLYTIMNGFPKAKSVYYDDGTRVFNVQLGGKEGTKLARVCFYIEDDVLKCNIQRGHYGEGYEPGFYISWDVEDLIFYGLIEVSENYDD